MNHNNLPIISALSAYKNQNITRFDVPGHKQGRGVPILQDFFGPHLMALDTNSAPPIDNLSHPVGIIKEAQHLMAHAYQADAAFFITEGTTTAIHAMLMYALSPGDKVIMPRDMHKSSHNALILTGAIPLYLDDTMDMVDNIAQLITQHQNIKAVLLLNPTYYGQVSPLKKIRKLLGTTNILLLTDEAHGAHFPFHPSLPLSGMAAGADIAAVSVHKTGGSLTQSSILLIKKQRVNQAKLQQVINMLHSTSASYLLMASLDGARHNLVLHGERLLQQAITLANTAREAISAIPGLSTNQPADHTKLFVATNAIGLTGFAAYDMLWKEYHIQAELADFSGVLFVISLGDTQEGIDTLVAALAHMATHKKQPPITTTASINPTAPLVVMSPREAFYCEKEVIDIRFAPGMICGEQIMAYPPGIPLIAPGEKITTAIIHTLKQLQASGAFITDSFDEALNNIVVIKEKKTMDQAMDLWYTENWTPDVRFSIKVKEQLYSKQSPFQKIDIFDSEEFGRFLTLDGLMMANEKDEFIYHDSIVHPAMCVNPHIKNVLVIGAGDGGTVRELTRYATIQKIDMVEIDELVTRACIEHLPQTAGQLDDPRVNLVFKDGIDWVKNTADGTYDLVIVDSTDPIGPGEGLFSVDFYKDAYRILTTDGILVNQHESPYFTQYAKEMKRAHSKIKKIFPEAHVYQAHIPTYPSGHWLFGFASKTLHPLQHAQKETWEKFGLQTKYYNTDIHTGAFMLPSYVKDMLKESE